MAKDKQGKVGPLAPAADEGKAAAILAIGEQGYGAVRPRKPRAPEAQPRHVLPPDQPVIPRVQGIVLRCRRYVIQFTVPAAAPTGSRLHKGGRKRLNETISLVEHKTWAAAYQAAERRRRASRGLRGGELLGQRGVVRHQRLDCRRAQRANAA